MTLQIPYNKLYSEFCNALCNAAMENNVPTFGTGIMLNVEVRDWDEWLKVYFRAISELSRHWTWSEVTQRRFITCVDTGIRFWMQIESTNSVRCGSVN